MERAPISRRGFLVAAASGAAATAAAVAAAGCEPGAGPGSAARQRVKLVYARPVDQNDAALWEQAVQRYRTQAPNVEIDYVTVPVWAEYWDKLISMMSGGVQIDTVEQHSTRVVPFAAKNLIIDLAGVIRRSPLPKDVYASSIKLFSYKGKQYGIAWDIAMQGLYYNRTVLDGAGVKFPDDQWTWDSYVQAARQATRGEGQTKVFGTVLLPLALQFLNGWIVSNGGRLFDDAQTRCLVTETPAVDTIQWIADLRVKHRAAPTPEEEAGQNLFNLGRAGLQVGGNFVAVAAIKPAQTQGWALGTAPVPKGAARRAGMLGGSAHAVATASKQPDAAWELAKYMSLDDERIKAFGATGRTMSPRRSLEQHSIPQGVDGAAFKRSFVDTMDTAGVTPPFTPNWPDIDRVFTTELAPVWIGQKSARDAAAAIKPQVELLLSQLPPT